MAEHDGHRQRIIAKLDSGTLEPHEILEVFLFNAIPRRNTNDIAHRLLNKFGSVDGVFRADVKQLQTVDGVGASVASYLRTAGMLFNIIQKERGEETFPEKFEPFSFKQFIAKAYQGEKMEVIDFYLINERQKILCRERYTCESKDFVQMSSRIPSELIARCKPAGLIIVHNHLTPNCMPSEMDDRATYQLQMICSMHNVLLCDHLIYSSAGIYSYYDTRRLHEISERFSIDTILKRAEEEKQSSIDTLL